MTNVTRIKPIHTAIAQPGAGKTEALLTQIPFLVAEGKRIVLALPTIVLSDAITKRASAMGITPRTIDHRSGELVAPELTAALRLKQDSFLICTQEAIRRVHPSLFRGWMLIVDELPKVVDYPDYSLKPIELERVLDYTEERSGQLWIKDGLDEAVRDQITTNRADASGTDCSTLGSSAAHIFRLLLCGVDVFIDQPQENGKRHIRAVEEHLDWWKIFATSDEVHVLAANVAGSEFEKLAHAHGFTFCDSMFTPEQSRYTSTVTIYPLMPKGQTFSRARMLTRHGNERLIDLVLRTTLEQTQTRPLLFASKWAGLERTRNVQYVPKDCRGLNSYDTATEAILLFGGNPSPADALGLEFLREQYGEDFRAAFVTTRLLEPSLQAVTRTAIRCKGNTEHIRLFVQDERVAQYLVQTYLPDAEIDWSLSKLMPVKPDGRRAEHPQREMVNRLLEDGVAIKSIARLSNVTAKTIRRWRDGVDAA
ncbi:hypothetical protein F3I62_11095 [Pseudomonas sp. R-28-1W-6]|nr:hypothetical protein [Pseudomonas sp. R-28-1W-6]